jgi:hypothetical protein
MYVWVPFKIPAECMEYANHARFILFRFTELRKMVLYRICSSGKKNVQQSTVLSEIFPQYSWYRKDNMPVWTIQQF